MTKPIPSRSHHLNPQADYPPYETFAHYGNAKTDKRMANQAFYRRAVGPKNRKRAQKNPEVRSAAQHFRSTWDMRTAHLYEGKPYKSPYNARKGMSLKIENPLKGTSF